MKKNTSQQTYKSLKLLGQGSFGKAYLVECSLDKSKAVIKTMLLENMNEDERKEAYIEAKILERLDHPNIIRFIEVFRSSKPYNTLNIVMDYADKGDLQSRIKQQKKPFNESQILDWFCQISLAIKHIHDKKILHRDLKSGNIFLTSEGKVKLGDFGIAKCLNSTFDKAKTLVGTPYYLSPEIVQDKPYSFKSDIWSLGILLYEMTVLKMPFEASSLPMLSLKIVRGNYSPIPLSVSKELRALIQSLLQIEAKNRPSITEILRHNMIKPRIRKFLNDNEYEKEFNHTVLHGYKVLESNMNSEQYLKQNQHLLKNQIPTNNISSNNKNSQQHQRISKSNNTNHNLKSDTTTNSEERSPIRKSEKSSNKDSKGSDVNSDFNNEMLRNQMNNLISNVNKQQVYLSKQNSEQSNFNNIVNNSNIIDNSKDIKNKIGVVNAQPKKPERSSAPLNVPESKSKPFKFFAKKDKETNDSVFSTREDTNSTVSQQPKVFFNKGSNNINDNNINNINSNNIINNANKSDSSEKKKKENFRDFLKQQKNQFFNQNQTGKKEDIIFLPGRNKYDGNNRQIDDNNNSEKGNQGKNDNEKNVISNINNVSGPKHSNSNVDFSHKHDSNQNSSYFKNKNNYNFDEYVPSDNYLIKNVNSLKAVKRDSANFNNNINGNNKYSNSKNEFISFNNNNNSKNHNNEMNYVVTKQNKKVDPFVKKENSEKADDSTNIGNSIIDVNQNNNDEDYNEEEVEEYNSPLINQMKANIGTDDGVRDNQFIEGYSEDDFILKDEETLLKDSIKQDSSIIDGVRESLQRELGKLVFDSVYDVIKSHAKTNFYTYNIGELTYHIFNELKEFKHEVLNNACNKIPDFYTLIYTDSKV